MGKTNSRQIKSIITEITDPSLEFDIFEMVRRRLVQAFMTGGRERLEAEKIAVYVVEGLQHVPKFLNVLTKVEAPTQDEILDALGPVLDEAGVLDKAKHMLLHTGAE